MDIQLPTTIEQLLERDRALRAAVDGTIANFEPWISSSHLPFFPDYTDHGPRHIRDVLFTCAALMTDASRNVLSPADAAVLTIATLLHDCAMHITEDGFTSLVTGDYPGILRPSFDNAAWPDLWDAFIFEARRWDDATRRNILGEGPEGESSYEVRRPSLDKNYMTRMDRLVIGEFIRRHHARLAHEIAIVGVPGPAAHRLRLDANLTEELADIAGLVARSHGLPIRACLDYLAGIDGVREYRSVHAIFLMALLRVSDYLQIQADRAPRQRLLIERIRSPFSLREWTAHQAVTNIHTHHEDPEAVTINALPHDVHTFLRLQEWLVGIQSELDAAWAVLGEAYGRYEQLKELALEAVS